MPLQRDAQAQPQCLGRGEEVIPPEVGQLATKGESNDVSSLHVQLQHLFVERLRQGPKRSTVDLELAGSD